MRVYWLKIDSQDNSKQDHELAHDGEQLKENRHDTSTLWREQQQTNVEKSATTTAAAITKN